MMKKISGNSKNKTSKICVIAAVLFIFQFLASFISGKISRLFDYSAIDEDSIFMQVSVHHISQMLITLMAIFFLYIVGHFRGFKLRPAYDKKGIKYTALFCAVIALYYFTIYFIICKAESYDYELNVTNVAGTLGFQLLLSGTSEEIMFRSLPIVIFLHYLDADKKGDKAIAVVLASLLFAVAHINFVNMEFSWFQLCYAFVLGLAYGYTFIRSKSVIYPMIMHSMSNVISVGGCYLYMQFIM